MKFSKTPGALRGRALKPKKVIFLGHFGAGNLGNECTLQAVIERTRQRWPQASLECACTGPEDVASRHDISAISWKPVITPPPVGAKIYRIFRELAHVPTCLRTLSQSDSLIVCGTNVVSDFDTGPKGWPFDLFKWSLLAALCRVRILYLGIGVGPIYHPVSRWLIKRSLRFADYRSYRDEVSKQWVERIGVNTDQDAVYPDLVFGLSEHLFRSSPNDRAGQRPVIGVGLKDYNSYDAKSKARETNTYQDYLGIMVAFVRWLCEQGYNVRLLWGDIRYDVRVTEDVLNAIKGQFPGEERVFAEPAVTLQQLLNQLAETEFVISPRFHNLVLSLMLNKPVIALSDHHKLDSLMAGLGLADYCQPLGSMSADSLTKLFVRLQSDSEGLKARIRSEMERCRKALDEEYASAFAKVEFCSTETIAGVSETAKKLKPSV